MHTHYLEENTITNTFEHWDSIYKTQKSTQVSWHQKHSTVSLEWLLQIAHKNDVIIDIGSGVSLLVDDLLAVGYTRLFLLEISTTAIQTTKKQTTKPTKSGHFF